MYALELHAINTSHEIQSFFFHNKIELHEIQCVWFDRYWSEKKMWLNKIATSQEEKNNNNKENTLNNIQMNLWNEIQPMQ